MVLLYHFWQYRAYFSVRYCHKTGNALVGIDLSTGEFHIESENIEEVMPLHDDLFVYRGLDEEDLKNIFLVAEYVKLTQN